MTRRDASDNFTADPEHDRSRCSGGSRRSKGSGEGRIRARSTDCQPRADVGDHRIVFFFFGGLFFFFMARAGHGRLSNAYVAFVRIHPARWNRGTTSFRRERIGWRNCSEPGGEKIFFDIFVYVVGSVFRRRPAVDDEG